ncbi:uncharacterized protein [Physcomitrium patens]|uniref:DNA mismatch repair proteins mutS family domain-containing protein n=1 Tax=Physcomitrium patens TaxID=3218 RepID=A0A7I4FQJ8_PHYPA|nr:uncharacterized protein LOC112283007 isoform X1 [Physcomitrium patens]XP_024377064.1 uncharacterized protein LOC112283007 isoform X1 [Physcomitrium patens]XP_024377065.1 uncharacterized protein LOC112283007 isoform X1 [Physcomitrium patens]|eukprot:XP_024377063.1 uncharacterized protein LOC112283007 isoform X1 [Physcomitrella patens]
MAKPLLLPATTAPVLKNHKKGLVNETSLSCSYPTGSNYHFRSSPHQKLAWDQRVVVVAVSRRGWKLLKAAQSQERLGLGNVAFGRATNSPSCFGCHDQRVRSVQATLQEKDGVALDEEKSAAMETLELLEWPRVCRAVASFAATTLAKEQLQVLEIPATREASEALLELTSAGVEFISLLGGPFELGVLRTQVVKDCILRIRKGMVVSGVEALAVAMLLQTSGNVRRQVSNTAQEFQDRQSVLEPIVDMLGPMATHPELEKGIWRIIDEDGTVKDSASPELRKARIQERSVEQRLRELFNKISRDKGANIQSEEVVLVDGRMCLVVASDNRSNVPGLLLRSGSGATSYIEPAGAVPLNNKLSEARAEVAKAEYNVLSRLTDQLRPYLDDIQFCLNIIVRLDVIMARARYSTWLGATKPTFIDTESQSLVRLQLRRARHPLLVQRHREALRDAKAALKSKSKLICSNNPILFIRHLRILRPSFTQNLGRLKSRAGTMMALQETKAAVAEAEAEVAELEENAPVPIDVRVVGETKVVAITGPNTGGKTATIKTVGLAALMAKSGLFVLGIEPVVLPWFDAVLADIGDEQSLSQSLSTFSGHLRRIKRIKEVSTGSSLVLLDEVGAGTDPTEGAALGMALLESFAQSGKGGSYLTMATTHHGELKTLKYSDSRFENASVEFSEEKLRPTYKLLWGIPGRSNAINIAERLGVPKDILDEARTLYGVVSAQLSEVIMELELAKRDFDQDIATADSQITDSKMLLQQLVAVSKKLQENQHMLDVQRADRVAAAAGAARSQLHAIARDVKSSTKVPLKVPPSFQNTNTEVTQVKQNMKVATNSQAPKGAVPSVGDMVYVPKLGRNAKVVEVKTSKKEVTVQSGAMQVKVKLKEIQWPGLVQA